MACDVTGYDSDETIEMTEEEIDLAYNNVVSKIRKWQIKWSESNVFEV